MKNDLNDFTLEELKTIKQSTKKYMNMRNYRQYLNNLIIEKEKNLEDDFNLEKFKSLKILDSTDIEILKLNGITSIQELENADLNSFMGMTESLKVKIDWILKIYNYKRGNYSGKRK